MSRKKDPSRPKVRFSPTKTVANLSDDFVEGLTIPELPEQIPQRLETALRRRVAAYLYQLREAKKAQYVPALEIRLLRDAHRAVLTAYELGLSESDVYYAEFRRLVEELGYERTDVGFKKHM
jgi:hypothetical protein